MLVKVRQSDLETAVDDFFSNGVTTLSDSLGHARHRFFGAGQTQKDQLHPIAGRLPTGDIERR